MSYVPEELLSQQEISSFLAKEPLSSIQKAKRNAELVLQYSTAYPFRIRGKDIILCVYCHEECSDPKDYRRHMDDNHKTFTISTAFAHCGSGKDYLKVDLTNLKCRLCSIPCENLEEIALHIRDTHEVSIYTDFDIGMHPYRLDSDKWICAVCDKRLASLIQLCRHTTSHYQRYTCDVCGRMYLTENALKHHNRCSHSGSNVCRKCWTEFPTLEMKREHVKTSKPCWPFCCTACGERFVSGEKRQTHLNTVHGQERKQYECPDCDLTFKSRRPFYNHFTLVHSDNSDSLPKNKRRITESVMQPM